MDRKLRSYDNKSQLRSSLQLHWIGILTLKWNPTSEHFSLLRGRTENIENLLGNVYEHKSKLWYQCFLQPNVFIFFIFYEIFFSFFLLKKEFIGPGLHLRPVHADHARLPLQWTLNYVFGVYGNNNRRIRPPPDRGILKIISRLLIA